MAIDPKVQAIIDAGVRSGKSKQDVERAVQNFYLGIKPVKTVEQKPQTNYIQQVADVAGAGAQRVAQGFEQAKMGEGKTPVDALESGLKVGAGAVQTAFSPLAPLFSPIGKLIGYVSNKIAEAPEVQRFAESEAGKTTARITEDVADLSTIAGAATGVRTTPGVASASVKAAQSVVNTADEAFRTASNLKTNIQTAIGKSSVNPQFASSAERLFLDGAKRVDDPVSTYNKYVEQSKKAISDAKQDAPISTVGEQIGDAFSSVVKQRRAVGNVMAEELKKVGGTKTDVLPVQDKFVKNLSDEGLSYDRVSKNLSQKTRQTKMTSEDLTLIERYARELQKLGSKPTLAELDAFMSRFPKEIDIYKSSKNIIGTTNAERIIKQSLAELRNQFDPVKSGNKELTTYANARTAYAELSDFLEEGGQYLGKITQSGDFAKDASLAKSAVQSILNNGKKDWLIKLEALTGYQAIDESVLALQAMKDAGDFRGLSLLQAMSEGSVPTSKAGFTQMLLDYAVSAGKRAVAGTPEEQTRAFLNELASKSRQGTSQ